MKKIIFVLIVLVLVLNFMGCDNKSPIDTATSNNNYTPVSNRNYTN